jgi:hypothetical protein
VVAQAELLPAGTAFELREQTSTVFYNDPAAARAGVISFDGSVHALVKYHATTGGALTVGGQGGGASDTGTSVGGGGTGPTQGGQRTALSLAPRTSSPGPIQRGPLTPSSMPAGTPVGGAVSAGASTAPTPGSARIEISAPQATVGAPLMLRVVVVDASGPAVSNAITSVSWSFGDGATGSGTQVRHAWATAGLYQVTAMVGLADGLTAAPATDVTVTAQAPPTAAIAVNPVQGTAPLTVTVDATGSRAGAAPIAGYRFDFGDGSQPMTSGSASATHGYTRAGTYTVRVTVTDTGGRSGAAAATVTVTSSGPS